MAWNGSSGSSGSSGNYAGQYNSQTHSASSGSNMQPHYASAYYAQGYYAQPSVPQPMQITVPSPGFARNQPMASLVPMHMRNRVGPVRCGHEGCMFAGSHKEVEVHKMDRHLIFPPGWQEGQVRGKRKRGKDKEEGGEEVCVDEEAQFLANGSAILGTDAKLDTPEAIAAWVEDRKKRWPSAKRVMEKAQSRQEALERGQILAEPQRLRHPTNDGDRGRGTHAQRGRGRGRGRGREFSQQQPPGTREGAAVRQSTGPDLGWAGRARGRGRGTDRGNGVGTERNRGRGRGHGRAAPSAPTPSDPESKGVALDSSTGTSAGLSSDSDSIPDSDLESDAESRSDMDPVRDAVPSKAAVIETVPTSMEIDSVAAEPAESMRAMDQTDMQSSKRLVKKRAAQPPKPVYNPFNQRPSLLRNLLNPDIQATVSNLSQAIRFLVANDFLENVELKPGGAEDVPVQPINTGATNQAP
ncbi:hypothetical protein BDV93DRAFT_522009 [Ceratobasidium sp. AG-I]|nr:hypothetical protein BDV93DRAFT_522009 [Ceratobasidium sp. AG-I]